jgi:serine protease Do
MGTTQPSCCWCRSIRILIEEKVMTTEHEEQGHRRLWPSKRPSKRTLAATTGLAMLAIAGTSFGLATRDHTRSLMSGSSALAAEVVAPSLVQMPTFANLVDSLKPTVVSVYVDAEADNGFGLTSQRGEGQNPPGPGSPFEFFFRQFGQPSGPNAPNARPPLVHAQGSGFFISADGYILTNNHVVDHAKRVQVKTIDGKTYAAKVVGTDPKTDLAVLKVEGSGDFKFAKLSSEPPRVGDWVLAMGNPYGLGGTVTAGIVSASGRDIGSGPYDDYLQIDAPVNKGNSGGPSFNMRGEVVGINTAIYSPSGGSVGIAFDIPAPTAKMVAEQLMTKGSVTRGWVGVLVQPVTADIADSLGLGNARGALIDRVQPGSPAAKAGLESGDIVTALGNAEIKDARDLARKVAQIAPGTTLKLHVKRNGADRTISLTAASYPKDGDKLASSDNGRSDSREGKLGLYLAPADQVEGAGSRGVVVMGVNPQSAAATKGVRQGDVILDAGGQAVSRPGDVDGAIAHAKESGKRAVLLRLKTAQGTRYVALPLGQG